MNLAEELIYLAREHSPTIPHSDVVQFATYLEQRAQHSNWSDEPLAIAHFTSAWITGEKLTVEPRSIGFLAVRPAPVAVLTTTKLHIALFGTRRNHDDDGGSTLKKIATFHRSDIANVALARRDTWKIELSDGSTIELRMSLLAARSSTCGARNLLSLLG